MTIYFISLVLGLVSMIAFLFKRAHGANPTACALKALTSSMFVISAVVATCHITNILLNSWTSTSNYLKLGTPIYGAMITIGLLFGLMGDIWLDLKFVNRDNEKFWTYAGFISFAFGHLIYIAAIVFDTRMTAHPLFFAIPVVVATLIAVLSMFGEKLLKLKYGDYAGICGFYVGILSMTLLISISAIIYSHVYMGQIPVRYIVMSVGALFFVISDVILSGTYFGEGKDRPVDIITNHVTYYLGQFLIAASILFTTAI